MTEPRDPNQVDPYLQQPNQYDSGQIDPSTQTFEGQPSIPTERPSAGITYGRSSSYTPPHETQNPWAPAAWPQQTPQHWLEPLPGQDRRRRRARGTGFFVALALVIALTAGAVGSAATYLALMYSGNLSTIGAVPPQASPTPAVQPSSSPQTVVLDEQTAITQAAEAVSPAVVTITVREGESTDPFSLPETGVGSGIIYDVGGYALTNRHVVAGATQVTVELADGRRFPASVYGFDTLTDLAIVKIDGTALPVAQIGDSSTLKPGQTAIVIGSPLGTFTNSVTSGVISALGRQLTATDPVSGEQRPLRNLIQTDAPINPGNSGGPLVNAAGQVVGVSTAYTQQAQGIFFAIPINIAKPIMRQAVAGEELSRPWIGIAYVPLNRNVAEENDLPIDYGAWIDPETADGSDPVKERSPALAAGVQAGDIVTAIDGRRIDASLGLDDILSLYEPGDRLTLSVLRGGQTLQLGLTLGTRPAELE